MLSTAHVSSWLVFKEFVSILWRYRRLFYAPLAMTFILQILWMLPRMVFPLIVLSLETGDRTAIGVMLLVLLVNNYLSYKVEIATSWKRIKNIRLLFNNAYIMECIRPISKLGYRFHVSFPAPRTEGRINDADEIADMVEWIVENFVPSIMQFFISFIPLAIVMPPMVVFTFVVLVTFIVVTVKMVTGAEAARLQLRNAFEGRRDRINDVIEGNPTLEINCAIDRKLDDLEQYGTQVLHPAQLREANFWLTGYGLQREQLMQYSTTAALALLIGCVLVPDMCLLLTGRPEMSLPQMLLIYGLVQPMFQSLWRMAEIITTYIWRSIRIHSLIELTRTPSSRSVPPDAVVLPLAGLSFEAVDLEFTYNDNEFAHLRRLQPDTKPELPPEADTGNVHIGPLNFLIPAGSSVGIVGTTGCGKTTLFNLMLGRYHPTAGRLLVNGVDITTIDHHQLLEMIGVVTQDTQVFRTTVFENIALGDDVVTRDRAQEALRIANLDGDLLLDTRVGERGLKLSGGQRQRLTIARAVAKDRLGFFLDEATSAVDSLTEAVIHSAMAEVYAQRPDLTKVVVAHRFFTIIESDMILVMDKGQIVESGTHAQLMTSGGIYARMAELQGMH